MHEQTLTIPERPKALAEAHPSRNNEEPLRFGRWTVLGPELKTQKGERKLLCRCQCGTERYVLERALKSGGSLSCGCLRKKNAADSIAYDLTGKTFGELYVVEKAEKQDRNGGVWWRCECSCGRSYEVPATLLVTGKRTHCGGKDHAKNYAFMDITGRRFHRLMALEPTKKRDEKGSVIWRCRCECGNEVEVAYNSLMYSEIKSCGCRKAEHNKALGGFLTRVGGTSLDLLNSRKLPVNNTSGVKGVYFIRGRYVAKIVFQKKQYFLGKYETLEEAAEVRKEAEILLREAVVAHHARWEEKAKRDPEWAKNNPIHFVVEKDGQGRLRIQCLPELETVGD